MSKILEKVAAFFESHPDATVVYEALGVLFTEKEKAEKYLAGVAGRMVTNHTRDGVNFERESDRIRHDIMNQENVVNQLHVEYENAPMAEKQQAMSSWESASRKLDDLKARLEKQIRLESKEEQIAKSQKAVPEKELVKKPRTREQLIADISSQVATIATNEELISTMRGGKKRKRQSLNRRKKKKFWQSLKKNWQSWNLRMELKVNRHSNPLPMVTR